VTIIVRLNAADNTSVAVKMMLSSLGIDISRESNVRILDLRDLASIESCSLDDAGPSTLVAPFSCLGAFLGPAASSGSPLLRLSRSVKKVFFHTLDSPHECEPFLKYVFGDPTAHLVQIVCRPANLVISGEEREICGPLAGLTVRSTEEIAFFGLAAKTNTPRKMRSIIESDSSGVLVRLVQNDLDIFMLFASRLVDLNQSVDANLDIRTCLLALAAPLMMLKHFSGSLAWNTARSYANIIIDDPPLSLRYGDIDFRRVYGLVAKHEALATLAYIPYNYRRGNKKAVAFFRKTSDRFGFCIHGCNHTKSEFGGSDAGCLGALSLLASERMRSFSERTGIPHTRIMVFPQGVFSSHALAVLKRQNFDAAVNTELRDASSEQVRVTVGDLLQPAVTCHDGFPLFLRRKISDGIENCAFDLLLGKPCLIVTHHSDFSSETSPVWQLVDSIHSLPNPPEWRPLEDLVARTGLLRVLSDNEIELKIFSRIADLDIALVSAWSDRLRVVKDEPHPETISRISIGERECEWHARDHQIFVHIGVRSQGTRLTVLYRQGDIVQPMRMHVRDRLGALSRRYLSEFRDNYLSKSSAFREMVRLARKLSS
jgi:hypothetical protein